MIEALSGTPSAGPAAGAATGGLAGKVGAAMGKEDFLQLLVAQLRNQDPMSPTNPEDFAAQLAQFSTLEGMLNMQESLESQAELQEALLRETHGATAVGLMGKEVLAVGDAVRVSGDPGQSVTVGVGGGGGAATLHLLDQEGNVVGSRPLGRLEPGQQEVALGDAAEGLEPGSYRYAVEVTGADGTAVQVQTFSRLVVDGVRYGPDGPVLTSGGTQIPLADVVKVSGGSTNQSS